MNLLLLHDFQNKLMDLFLICVILKPSPIVFFAGPSCQERSVCFSDVNTTVWHIPNQMGRTRELFFYSHLFRFCDLILLHSTFVLKCRNQIHFYMSSFYDIKGFHFTCFDLITCNFYSLCFSKGKFLPVME